MTENKTIIVFEVTLFVYLLKDIRAEDQFAKIGSFVDKGMTQQPELLEFHQKNCYKNYCWNLFHPIEKDKLYKKDAMYRFQLRTVDSNLAEFFSNKLVNCCSDEIKGLKAEIKIVPRNPIEKIYSLTPVILKDAEKGYWKTHLSLKIFEKRLKENLWKKYNAFTGKKPNEDFPIYNTVIFLNKTPIALKYKNITFLGDKLELIIDQNETAQRLAYFSLGTGLLELNARGGGFMNYRWVEGRR